jgi:preprotein translocase subunit YajC
VFLVLLQQPAPQSGGLAAFLPLIFIIGIFYLIVFLPARRRQKKVQGMIDSLKSGDKVITTGGLFGTVVALRGDKLGLRIAENVKVEISRNAVASMQQPDQE